MIKGYHIFFSGMVQGVGFRFTAKHLANRFKIKGWVKNSPDGKVEIIAEAPDKDLGSFINALKEEFKRNITDYQTEDIPLSNAFINFHIK